MQRRHGRTERCSRGRSTTLLAANGIALDGDNIQIPNTAPDEGLSAPFNSWFTLFGQFFDHGLDLVDKGGSGTVFIPLMPDDPLYVPGSTDQLHGADPRDARPRGRRHGHADDVRPVNTTTSFVDQNQTYTSHASHQVFLRQYALNGAGDPVATGKLIEGANGGMATWGDVKAQAADLLGIQLTDHDVGNVPLLATDQYGNFIPGANGFPQVIFRVPPPAIRRSSSRAIRPPMAALGVLGRSPTPSAPATPSSPTSRTTPCRRPRRRRHRDRPRQSGDGTRPTAYDNELLDAHFIAGDGRVNENIGLTAVHHVFHAEHNRLVEHTKEVALADARRCSAAVARHG